MIRWLPLLMLAGCATGPSTPGSDADPAHIVTRNSIVTRAIRSIEPCKRLDRSLLQTTTKVEGPISLAATVATERGNQVDQLNSKLDAITKAINAGCVK